MALLGAKIFDFSFSFEDRELFSTFLNTDRSFSLSWKEMRSLRISTFKKFYILVTIATGRGAIFFASKRSKQKIDQPLKEVLRSLVFHFVRVVGEC